MRSTGFCKEKQADLTTDQSRFDSSAVVRLKLLRMKSLHERSNPSLNHHPWDATFHTWRNMKSIPNWKNEKNKQRKPSCFCCTSSPKRLCPSCIWRRHSSERPACMIPRTRTWLNGSPPWGKDRFCCISYPKLRFPCAFLIINSVKPCNVGKKLNLASDLESWQQYKRVMRLAKTK
jgi:hypothetical protein